MNKETLKETRLILESTPANSNAAPYGSVVVFYATVTDCVKHRNISCNSLGVSEWVIQINSLYWTADSKVHVVHRSCVIIVYTLKSLSSLMKIMQNLQTTNNLKKRGIEKRTTKKWGYPLSWLVIGDDNSTSVYKSSNTYLFQWTEIFTYCNNNPTRRK